MIYRFRIHESCIFKYHKNAGSPDTITKCDTQNHNSVTSYFEEYEDLLDILEDFFQVEVKTTTSKMGYSLRPTEITKSIKSTKKFTTTSTTSTAIRTTTSTTNSTTEDTNPSILSNLNQVNWSLEIGKNFLAKLTRINWIFQAKKSVFYYLFNWKFVKSPL